MIKALVPRVLLTSNRICWASTIWNVWKIETKDRLGLDKNHITNTNNAENFPKHSGNG